MKKFMNWVLAATLVISGTMVFTACSSSDDNSVVDNSLAEKIVGKWIHADTDGEAVTTDMKSVYTFTNNGSALKGFYSMSMTGSGVWAYNQETDVAISGNNVTLTSHLADGVSSVVELTNVTVSGDDLRFTAKTTLSKDGQVTATYGPRQEHFTKVYDDFSTIMSGVWEGTVTSDDPAFTPVPFREEYRPDGTFTDYELKDDQWVKAETDYADYFIDGTLFCTRWKYVGEEEERENWINISYENGVLTSQAMHKRDGIAYTYTSKATKVE